MPKGVPDDSEPMEISGDEEEESKNEKKACWGDYGYFWTGT